MTDLLVSTPVFFVDAQSPRQRRTNENISGLLHCYFPKGTDLSRWTADELLVVADTINNRPRKVLNWRAPSEVFNEQIDSLQQANDASTI